MQEAGDAIQGDFVRTLFRLSKGRIQGPAGARLLSAVLFPPFLHQAAQRGVRTAVDSSPRWIPLPDGALRDSRGQGQRQVLGGSRIHSGRHFSPSAPWILPGLSELKEQRRSRGGVEGAPHILQREECPATAPRPSPGRLPTPPRVAGRVSPFISAQRGVSESRCPRSSLDALQRRAEAPWYPPPG